MLLKWMHKRDAKLFWTTKAVNFQIARHSVTNLTMEMEFAHRVHNLAHIYVLAFTIVD
ncbi:putative defensin-like protein 165 [Phtheirospermum japonicum]|uniref:Putative defensin-like protein 165 n=1 Tax=Phtheirospermum japonicum TaxID=374723 RepID=A0A830B7C3_9LAMI|nr:putative defensin-like protein 165 [Phtheirospermum japonicum]